MGLDLVELMDAQVHRGADSTGFALYGPPREQGFIVRAVGMDRAALDRDLDDFLRILRAHGSDFLEDPTWDRADTPHVSVRMVVGDIRDLDRWSRDADAIAGRVEVQSVGRSLEVIKDIGAAAEVADKHGVPDFSGTHGLGHARLATESSASPTASHPFWARPFPDVAIVHNGQITDYYLWRNRLERRGYRFMTENDSELIAVWISDRMRRGTTKPDALGQSIREIDGVFTYLIADERSNGVRQGPVGHQAAGGHGGGARDRGGDRGAGGAAHLPGGRRRCQLRRPGRDADLAGRERFHRGCAGRRGRRVSVPDGANRIEVLAADRPIREVNEEIRAAVATGRKVVVRDARSRHNLGVGLPAAARVRFEGSVGYYCGGLNDGSRIEIERNAGWGVGEAMARGEIVVGGYAGMAAGASMRGGCCTFAAMPALAAGSR